MTVWFVSEQAVLTFHLIPRISTVSSIGRSCLAESVSVHKFGRDDSSNEVNHSVAIVMGTGESPSKLQGGHWHIGAHYGGCSSKGML